MIISRSLAIIILAVFSFNAQADHVSTIKSRMAQDLILDLSEKSSVDLVKNVEVWHKKIQSNGKWSDIKYHLDDNQFSPGEHPKRMDWMARAYKTPSARSTYLNPSIKEAILKSFDAWLELDIQSYNWWNNEIGVPQRFTRTMLLLENELGAARLKKGIKFLEKVKIYKTGQNRLWFSEIVLTRALFARNDKEIKLAIGELQNVLVINPAGQEGIQVDLSFQQHGALIYNGGYGAKFSTDMARLVNFFVGTPYSFSKDKVEILGRYILDSQIWMTRGSKWDYSVVGRELARPKKDAQVLAKTCHLLSKAKIPRQEEYKKCHASLAKGEHYLKGNRSFYRSDYMLHQDPKFFASVRMYSERTLNNDAPSNGEGLLSHHLADGGMFLMQRGDEYEDIFPVWDWARIPGTTTEIKKLRPAKYTPGDWDAFAHIRYSGKSSFVGSVSNRSSGLAAMDFISNKSYEKLDVKKAWILSDFGILAAGNNISCESCLNVSTNIDQKLLKGRVFVKTTDGNVIEHFDEKTYNNLIAVFHDGIIYKFNELQNVTVLAKHQNGSWGLINQQHSKNDRIIKSVFSLWINHRIAGVEYSDSYAYSIFPSVSLIDLERIDLSKIELVNESSVIGSYNNGIVYLSIFKAGTYLLGGHRIEVSHPCLIIYDHQKSELVVSDPTQNLSQLTVRVNGKEASLIMPSGDFKGSSLRVKL